jgi:hypothetical protein
LSQFFTFSAALTQSVWQTTSLHGNSVPGL